MRHQPECLYKKGQFLKLYGLKQRHPRTVRLGPVHDVPGVAGALQGQPRPLKLTGDARDGGNDGGFRCPPQQVPQDVCQGVVSTGSGPTTRSAPPGPFSPLFWTLTDKTTCKRLERALMGVRAVFCLASPRLRIRQAMSAERTFSSQSARSLFSKRRSKWLYTVDNLRLSGSCSIICTYCSNVTRARHVSAVESDALCRGREHALKAPTQPTPHIKEALSYDRS